MYLYISYALVPPTIRTVHAVSQEISLVLLARFSLKFDYQDIKRSESISFKLACAATITLLGPPETCDQIEVAHLSTRGRERESGEVVAWRTGTVSLFLLLLRGSEISATLGCGRFLFKWSRYSRQTQDDR